VLDKFFQRWYFILLPSSAKVNIADQALSSCVLRVPTALIVASINKVTNSFTGRQSYRHSFIKEYLFNSQNPRRGLFATVKGLTSSCFMSRPNVFDGKRFLMPVCWPYYGAEFMMRVLRKSLLAAMLYHYRLKPHFGAQVQNLTEKVNEHSAYAQ